MTHRLDVNEEIVMRNPMAEKIAKMIRTRLIHSSTVPNVGGIYEVDGVAPALYARGAAFRICASNGLTYEVKVVRC